MKPTPLVLVVDADPAVHELFARALGSDFAILGARSASLGLRLAEKRTPSVIALDPSGVDDVAAFVSSVKVHSPHARVLLLVADVASREDSKTLAQLGAVVAKPLDAERLGTAVRNMARLAAMSDGVQRMRTGTGAPDRLSTPNPMPTTRRLRDAPTKS